MGKYVTVIKIVSEGNDPLKVGQEHGELIKDIPIGTMISCEPTEKVERQSVLV